MLLRVVRKIAKKKDKCEKQVIDNEFAIELDKDELKLFKGLFMDVLWVIFDEILLVLFGSTLSSIISYPLTTQGQMSAVGTIVSAGYGFICGAYMPISNFGSGLQKALSYLPGTYGTSLIKNHMLRGIFEEMESEKLPDELITAIRETLDCNPQFYGNVVNTTQMVFIMAGSIVVLGAIFLLMTRLPEKQPH